MKKNFQLIAFNAVTAVFTALGIGLAPETAQQYAEALVTIGGGLWLIINAFLIKRRNAAQAIIVAQGENAAPVKTDTLPPASVLMLALLLLPMLSLSACNTFKGQIETDAQRVYAIDLDFQHASRLAVAYVESPAADPFVKATVQKLWAAADNALTAAQSAVRTGGDPKMPALISLAGDAVNELITYLVARGLADDSPPPRVPLSVANLHPFGEFRHGYP